ncbi:MULTISPECIES: hypothetical protein [unclassified Methylobacterium]|uniref:hypothetical protein n=1 Tax=unclassified Methylobacterium TaxID=2615210 RepID=UPI0011C20874|nr:MULTISPECIES: hypothetical protein [unclassified Methylobacterium]QEE37973.1 hypothetical protein FVA80_02310 [Methylobacterium sp. WL1]TXN59813.1 hypothetical protein FV241_00140 [Methylobacterium sp. WL2]
MIVDLKPYFQLIQVHHKLPSKHRFNDLLGRLSTMADPANDRMRVDPLTRQCLTRFLARRLQSSSTTQGVA